jgi:uncharacterized protein (TIGR02466 family)
MNITTGGKLKHVKMEALFAPVLDHFDIPNHQQLNRQLIAAIEVWRSQEAGITRSNYAGWHSGGNIFKRTEAPFVQLGKHFIDAAKVPMERIYDTETLRKKRLKLEGWVNVNGQHAYNRMHTHARFDLSGVYFVKIPPTDSEDSGILQFLNPSYRSGRNTDLWEKLSPQAINVKPTEGKMLVFPSSLPHWVLPNEEPEERISIAFNIRLEDVKI